MPKANRVTVKEKEKRIMQIQDLIIDGKGDNALLRMMTSDWKISIRQARRYLNDAYSRWLPEENITLEQRRASKIADLKQIRKGLKKEFLGTPQGVNAILRIERQIIRLEGIEPPKKMEMNINNAPVIQVMDVAKQKPGNEK